MSTFKKCDDSVAEMAAGILTEFSTYEDLLAARVRVDYVFAFGNRDGEGFVKTPALREYGVPVLGQTRILGPKDRAMGRGDAEVTLDHDWWENATEAQRKALLDHELHHLVLVRNEEGVLQTDDLERPRLKLRKHDVQVGWFKIVAARHGENSVERMQAKTVMDSGGQYFWPALTGGKLEYVKA